MTNLNTAARAYALSLDAQCPPSPTESFEAGWEAALGEIERLDTDAAGERAERESWKHNFKNFHRLLCERFGYVHDEKDWLRDQLSLVEHIAKKATHEPSDDLGDQIYALLVRRGYAQHEAYLIANGPGCSSDCVQMGYQDIACPEHGDRAQKSLGASRDASSAKDSCPVCGFNIGDHEAAELQRCLDASSGDFDKDMGHLTYLRAKHDARNVDVTFLFAFIDNLWRECVRDSRDATRYRWLRTNVNSGVTVLFDSKEGPDGIEGFDRNDEDFDASIDRLMTANAQRT